MIEHCLGNGGIIAGMVQEYNGDCGEGIMEIFGEEGKGDISG